MSSDAGRGSLGLLNFITEDRIARPKKLDALYGGLPEGARAAIEQRDAKT